MKNPFRNRPQVIVREPRTLTAMELFVTFTSGREEAAPWSRAIFQTLHNRRSAAIEEVSEADNADERARAAGAIAALDQLLADWEYFGTTPIENRDKEARQLDQDVI